MKLKVQKTTTVNAKTISLTIATDAVQTTLRDDDGNTIGSIDTLPACMKPFCANDGLLQVQFDIETGVMVNWKKPDAYILGNDFFPALAAKVPPYLLDALHALCELVEQGLADNPAIADLPMYDRYLEAKRILGDPLDNYVGLGKEAEAEAEVLSAPDHPAIELAKRFAVTAGAQDANCGESATVKQIEIEPIEDNPPEIEGIKLAENHQIDTPAPVEQTKLIDAEATAALNDDLPDDYATTAPDNQIDIKEQIARSIEIPETDLPTVSVVNINGKWTAQYGEQFASSSKSVFAAIDGALRKSGATGAFEINRHFADGNKEIYTVDGSRTQGRHTIYVSHSAAKNEWVARTSDNKRAASVVGVDGALIALLDTVYKTDPSEASPIETTDDEMKAEGKRRYSIIVPSVRKNPPAPPLYLNPDDHTKTWTGRGNPPAWLQEKLNAGAALEDFLIDGNSTHKPEKMPSYSELVQAISIAPNVAVLMRLQTNYVSKWPVFDQVSGLHRKINERSSELSNANPTD